MNRVNEQIVEAYGDLVASYIQQGWRPYLLSFMFKQLAGSERSKIGQMERHLETVYGILVTRAARKPKAKSAQGRLPILLCCPDLPIFKQDKRKTTSLRDAEVNDGLHYQAILLMPPESRMDDVAEHFRSIGATYAHQARLERVDVKPIVSRPHSVTGYAMKQVRRGRFGAGDILPFPRSLGELTA